jgi:16S rRNA (cytidine1402-2'-O)-methyltransferase
MPGKLYLLPTPLGEDANATLPDYVIAILHQLDFFIVEKAKTARHFIKSTGHPKPLPSLEMLELNEHTGEAAYRDFLLPLENGRDVGLMSEAGCPGVADPGAAIVKLAHQKGIEVIPLVGPSSILLALMASGLNGQRFCFQGYPTAKRPELARQISKLEQQSQREQLTQIFIEAPYRNNQLFEALTATLSPATLLCAAADLTLPTQYIRTQTVQQWRKSPLPDLHKRPAIFLFLSL